MIYKNLNLDGMLVNENFKLPNRSMYYVYTVVDVKFHPTEYLFFPELAVCGTVERIKWRYGNDFINENKVFTRLPGSGEVNNNKLNIVNIFTDTVPDNCPLSLEQNYDNVVISYRGDSITWDRDSVFFFPDKRGFPIMDYIDEVKGVSEDMIRNLNRFHVIDTTDILYKPCFDEDFDELIDNFTHRYRVENVGDHVKKVVVDLQDEEIDESEVYLRHEIGTNHLATFTWDSRTPFKVENFNVLHGNINRVISNILE